jgi:hypothetical protein
MGIGRYAKVDLSIWGDEKVEALSPVPPCGQGLWIRLLVTPHKSTIPGLLRVGEAALAEEFGWTIEAFREAFREAESLGMVKADWKARVVWLKNAWKYNRPESPNVVKSWRIPWNEVPACELKTEAFRILKAFAEGLGNSFAEAFSQACDKPSDKERPKSSANQDQDQDQKQDQEQEGDRARVVGAPGKPTPYTVVSTFLTIRAKVIGGGQGVSTPFAQPQPNELDKAERWLAGMTPGDAEDIEPAIRLACQHVVDGKSGWTHEAIRKTGFLLSAIISNWRDLREELHGVAPAVNGVLPQPNNHRGRAEPGVSREMLEKYGLAPAAQGGKT